MNLEEFQRSSRWSDDIASDNPDYFTAEGEKACGYIYPGNLVIESVADHWPEASQMRGQFYLMIGNDEHITDDLTQLEAILFSYGVAEGLF